MNTFDDYINNLKAEAERGSTPNYNVPLEKFIRVADNIATRITDVQVQTSMSKPHM
jgi:hypothetical protein